LSSVSSEDRDDLASQDLIRAVEIALEMAEIPGSLEPHGVTSEDLDVLATMATEQWTGRFNPKSLSKQDFKDLYRKALKNPS
jgi:alcohol dehydrogenase class IV